MAKKKNALDVMTSHAGYAAALAKASDLAAEADECRSSVRRMRAELHDLRVSGRNAGETNVDAAARRLLEGDDSDAAKMLVAMRDDLQAETERLRVLERAQELQAHVIRAERNAASKLVCAAARPEYRQLVVDAVKAAEGMGDAMRVLNDFRIGLENAGVHVGAYAGQSCVDEMLLPGIDRHDTRVSGFIANANELIDLLDQKAGAA